MLQLVTAFSIYVVGILSVVGLPGNWAGGVSVHGVVTRKAAAQAMISMRAGQSV